MEQNCKTCGWGRQIPNIKTIMKCGCPISGCYQTDVVESESCDRWKKASDDYLEETKRINIGTIGYVGHGKTTIHQAILKTLSKKQDSYLDGYDEPRFKLDEDSICYGCQYYKGEDEENSDICDTPQPCVWGSMNGYRMDG